MQRFVEAQRVTTRQEVAMANADILHDLRGEVRREAEREVRRLEEAGWHQRGPIWEGTWWQADVCHVAARTVMWAEGGDDK